MHFFFTSELDDNVIICDLHLLGRCPANKNCSNLHDKTSKLPYIWQVKIFGSWHSLEQSEIIEKSFCAKENNATVYTVCKYINAKLFGEKEQK